MKTKLLVILLTLFVSFVHSQDGQEQNTPLTSNRIYKSGADMKVYYTENNQQKTRTAKAGLKYRYLGKEDEKVLIRFMEITKDTDETGADGYVNQNNDDITYYIPEDEILEVNQWPALRLVSGTLLAPVKVRFSEEIVKNGVVEVVPWDLSTDVAIGQYLGLKIPITRTFPFYVTFPAVTLGTSLLSINSSNTDPNAETSTVLGLTWAVGAMVDLNGFNIGFMVGKDYAPGSAGEKWIYNEETWFSIGFGIDLTSDNREL